MATCVAIIASGLFTSCSSDDEIPFVNQESDVLKPVDDNPYAVTIEEAQKQLEEILAKVDGQSSTRSGATRKIKNKFTTGGSNGATRSENGEEHPVVHIFNFEDNGGFAIMAGDKRATPLLALTEGGELQQNMTTDNLGLIIMLDQVEAAYKEQLAEKDSTATRSTTVTTINGLTYVVTIDSIVTPNMNGMCPVQWGQDYPYNSLCPLIGNKHAYTGCTTTAVAQLMACHKYPPSYGAYTFDWDSMIADTNDNDIAQLMLCLGLPYNLCVTYGLDGSGASIDNVPTTLENFGYSSGGDVDDFDVSVIIPELICGQPVILSGYCTKLRYVKNALGVIIYYDSILVGHTWLTDGLMQITNTTAIFNALDGTLLNVQSATAHYLHCNMGWEGLDDKFYLSGFFLTTPRHTNQNVSGYIHDYYTDGNFQYNQRMVTGIRK